jgi:hypothetical protein
MDNKQSNQNSREETDIQWEERRKREDAEENLRLWEEAKEVKGRLKELAFEVEDGSSIKTDQIANHKDSGIKSANATPSLDSVDEIVIPASKYAFPTPELELYKEWDSGDIIDNLDSLSKTADKINQYLFSRNAFCALSIELNNRKLIAPAFRPSPTIPKIVKQYSDAYLAIQRDRLVIDCHWLHSRNEKVSVTENKWRGLLDSRKDFQYEKIYEFVCTSIKNEYRADGTLRLTRRQQCQLAALRGNKTRMQFDKLTTSDREKGKPRTPPRLEVIELGINHWCEIDRRVEKYRPQYFAIAKATELLGDGATAGHIGELTGLILGEKPLSERSILAKWNKLKRWLPT